MCKDIHLTGHNLAVPLAGINMRPVLWRDENVSPQRKQPFLWLLFTIVCSYSSNHNATSSELRHQMQMIFQPEPKLKARSPAVIVQKLFSTPSAPSFEDWAAMMKMTSFGLWDFGALLPAVVFSSTAFPSALAYFCKWISEDYNQGFSVCLKTIKHTLAMSTSRVNTCFSASKFTSFYNSSAILM